MVGSNRSFLAPLAFDFTPRSHRVEQLERSTEVQLVSPRRAFIYIYIYISVFLLQANPSLNQAPLDVARTPNLENLTQRVVGEYKCLFMTEHGALAIRREETG